MAETPKPRIAHPYHMHDCIMDQPDVISQVLQSQGQAAQELANRVASAERVHLVGIGTSWHASLVGESLLRRVGGCNDARAWNAFEFCAYPPRLSGRDVVVVLSHTGTTTYPQRALDLAGESGAVTALITGQDSSAKVEMADVVLRTSYGDKSSAYTVSHTAAMTALAMVAVRLAEGTRSQEASALNRLPATTKSALSLEPQVRGLVRIYKEMDWYCFAGWGPNAATAYEVALKVNESAYAITTAFQLEQFLHGPFVATSPGCLATFIAPPGPGYQRALGVARAVKETGAQVVALVQDGDNEMASVVDRHLSLPSVQEFLTPIAYLAPLQLFTYWLALERGCNPDTFRLDDPKHAAALKPITF
ncbi:MAG: SIS domain-containing protein [Dehalococcoidia bacterium]